MDDLALQPYRIIGRYALYDEIASGGMATVYFGRLLGPVGFSRTVAIKCLHPQFAKDPAFVSMFLDEARLAARIQHPNVVSTLDVVQTDGELFLVMEYVQGESLSRLIRRVQKMQGRIPPKVALSIASGALYGLHAAHEARSERGEPLGIVHRDISPQNVMVGVDGGARVLDFGVAKAAGRLQTTNDGQLKGKVAYMAPEQILGQAVDRRTDIYAASVVLWEALTGRRMFEAENPASLMNQILESRPEMPSRCAPGIPQAIDSIVMRGLSREPRIRFSTAREMAMAIEAVAAIATTREVGDWVSATAGDALQFRAEKLAEIESVSSIVPMEVLAAAPPRPPLTSASSIPSDASQGTGLSLSTTGFASRVRSGNKTFFIIGGVALGGLLVGIVAALILTSGQPQPAQSGTNPGTVDTDAAATPSATASASAEPAASETAAASVTAPPTLTAPPNTGKPWRAPPPPVTAVPPPPAKKCNPPYTVDEKGIKHPKPECY